ncbi:MAG: dTMP kinase [Clostridia bacterium]|jgi:dTMP kinase|nr:dTMP kinase [Clostridia bacterium]
MLKLQNNREKGKLIVFEGTDGAGKTTLIGMTAKYLSQKYGSEKVLVLKQPTDAARNTKLFQKMMFSEAHEEIDYRAVQLLTLSDRVQHNRETIVPALRGGKIVVCDRYIYTSVVNMLARGYDREKWFYLASRAIVKPDLAFLAYADPQTALERIKARPEEKDRYLNEGLLKKVAQYFMRYRKKFGLKLIETQGSAETAFQAIRKQLNLLLGGAKDE